MIRKIQIRRRLNMQIKSITVIAGIMLMQVLTSCNTTKKTTATDIPNVETKTETNAELPLYNATPTQSFDLIHTILRVSFDMPNQHMAGTAEIILKPHFYPTSILYLDARGMTINEVNI